MSAPKPIGFSLIEPRSTLMDALAWLDKLDERVTALEKRKKRKKRKAYRDRKRAKQEQG